MALTPVYKMKIIGYLKQCPSDRLSYPVMIKRLNGKDKVTYPEFLDYFLELAVTELKKEKTSLSFVNKVVLTLTSFIEWNVERDYEVSQEKLDSASNIKDLYETYKERTGEEHPDLADNIISLDEKIKELFPDYEKSVEVIEEAKDSKVIELESELKEVLEELKKYKDRVDELEKELRSKDSSLNKKNKKNVKLSGELEKKKNQLIELNKKIKECFERISELEKICHDRENTIYELSNQNEELRGQNQEVKLAIYTLNRELKALRKLVTDKEKIIAQYKQVEAEIQEKEAKILRIEEEIAKEEEKNKQIEDILVRRMLLGYSNILELVKYMSEVGFSLTEDQITYYVNKIIYSGTLDKLRKSKEEFVTPVGELGVREYNLPLWSGVRYYDMVVVSDFHLESFSQNIIDDMNLIYDYCVDNRIKLIVNAGDFFSFKHYNKMTGEAMVGPLERLIDRVIDKYPYEPNIKQAIVGGNHDKDAISYGVDPLDRLAKGRSDFINLGYGHGTISFCDGELNGIGIHHPNRRYQDFISTRGYDSKEVVESLNSYYISHSLVDRDSIYLDILGHIHRSSLDIENGICIAPSYRQDRYCNGAWHFKIFFDSNGNIKEIVCIPLFKMRRLIPSTEICYQKRLIK